MGEVFFERAEGAQKKLHPVRELGGAGLRKEIGIEHEDADDLTFGCGLGERHVVRHPEIFAAVPQ